MVKNENLSWIEIIKLIILFGLPLVIVIYIGSLFNPTTFIGKVLKTILGIFGYMVILTIEFYLTSSKDKTQNEIGRKEYSDFLERHRELLD